MLRALSLISVTLALVTALGIALCKTAGWNVGASGLAAAGAAALAASAGALIPLWLSRGASGATVAQAGLAGTVIHMMIAIGCAGLTLLVRDKISHSFIFWLLAFYWTTLTALVVTFAGAVKAASPAPETVLKQ